MVGPPASATRGQAPNHPELRWLKTVVVSVREKAHEMRQVGTRKTFQNPDVAVGVAVDAPLAKRHRKLGKTDPGDEPGGCPSTGQVVPGVKAA